MTESSTPSETKENLPRGEMDGSNGEARLETGTSVAMSEKLLAKVAKMTTEEQRSFLGERLYPMVEAIQAREAEKVTGMLLSMETPLVISLMANPESLAQKASEALHVLDQQLDDASESESQSNSNQVESQPSQSPNETNETKAQAEEEANEESKNNSINYGESIGESSAVDSKISRGREVAQASRNIYCWGIPRDWQYGELYLLAFACGEIESIRLGPPSQKPHTYAFVQFQDIPSARKAIELLNGRQLYDRKLVVKFAHPPRSSFSRNSPVVSGNPRKNQFPTSAAPAQAEMIPYIGSHHMYMGRPIPPAPYGNSQRYLHASAQNAAVSGPAGPAQTADTLAHHMHGLSFDSQYYPPSHAPAPAKYPLGSGGGGGIRNAKGGGGPLPTQSRTNVYIGNLPDTITEEKLSDIFKRYGNVVSTKVIMNRLTEKPLGTALVRMATHEQAQLAISQLTQSMIEQRRVYCRFANEKQRHRRDSHSQQQHRDESCGGAVGGLGLVSPVPPPGNQYGGGGGGGGMANPLAPSSFAKNPSQGVYVDYGGGILEE
mmetsp:Transcript_7239/g.8812  ORF Transcript_7239/g.8812 Transcript_7239/m.8812 type:complete len:548 (-) Transcript_7239:265-1908(-)